MLGFDNTYIYTGSKLIISERDCKYAHDKVLCNDEKYLNKFDKIKPLNKSNEHKLEINVLHINSGIIFSIGDVYLESNSKLARLHRNKILDKINKLKNGKV